MACNRPSAVGGTEADNPIAALVEALTDTDARVRKTAAQTLGKFGPAAREALDPLNVALEDVNRDVQKEMKLGQSMQIGPYTLLLQTFDTKPEQNYTAERLVMEVLRDNKPLMMLYPEKRRFPTNEENGTMVAIFSSLREDIYVVYAGQDPDDKLPVIHAFLNPLVKWIWLGGVFVVLGTLLALLPNRREALVLAAVPESVTTSPAGTRLQPAATLREGHD